MKTKQGNKTAAQIYLDWTNHFLSLGIFARSYGWTRSKALKIIEAGKREHERNVAARCKFIHPDGMVRPVRNLAPLLRRAHDVVSVTVRELPDRKALLIAVLPDGVLYEALFESFMVCRDFVSSVPFDIQEIPDNPVVERAIAEKYRTTKTL